jgi:hypothetical protein
MIVRVMAIAAALAAECAAQGGTALLRPVCGPTDGPAVQLELPVDGNHPQFRLRIDRPIGEVAGKNLVVRGPDDAAAYPQWCNAEGCDPVRSTAELGALRGDSSITVHVRTARPDGTPFEWRGVARWHGETLVCG